MLGVTLFGIFLTPVFFYVIEGLSERRPLGSVAAQRVGRALSLALTVLTLGLPLWLRLLLGKGWRPILPERAPVLVNGTAADGPALAGHGKVILRVDEPAPASNGAANGDGHPPAHDGQGGPAEHAKV
jgi:multidrug efflux pump